MYVFIIGGGSLLNNEELEEYSNLYYGYIFKYCMFFLSNKEDAEDATQETFAVFSAKGDLLDEKHILPWLLRTAHNMILREYRKRYLKVNRESVFDEKLLEASGKFTRFEEDMVSYYGEKHIKEVYNRLSDREKELFDLYSDGTLKTGEIAQLLGLEPHACSMRKKRLLEKCRDIMKEILFY